MQRVLDEDVNKYGQESLQITQHQTKLENKGRSFYNEDRNDNGMTEEDEEANEVVVGEEATIEEIKDGRDLEELFSQTQSNRKKERQK